MGRFTAVGSICVAFVLTFTATAAAALPTVDYSIDGIVGTNGWYRGSTQGDNVTLHWVVTNGTPTSNCPSLTITIPGPTPGVTETCSAQNTSGTQTATTSPIKIDATPPTGLRASFSRPPDSNGWYNHAVTISWTGTDATSGVAGCSSVIYQGPDSGTATVSGGCTDNAGNSAVAPVQLAYDATPPVLSHVAERSTTAADVLSWQSSSASDRVIVQRRVRGHKARRTVFDGVAGNFNDKTIRPGAEYLYSVQSVDQAANVSKVVSIAGPPKILLLQRTSHLLQAAPSPILRWRRVRSAAYYNVQLFRGSRRIYSAWPATHQAGLPTSWKWSGHRFRLTPGRYRWYVWAGLGARSLARYRFVGSAKFALPG